MYFWKITINKCPKRVVLYEEKLVIYINNDDSFDIKMKDVERIVKSFDQLTFYLKNNQIFELIIQKDIIDRIIKWYEAKGN